MNNVINNNRMQWVDAMRGFSMIIVVLGHVLISMGIGGYNSVFSSILLTFRMPLFFFVSGYFSYRVIAWWNRERLYDIMKRKFQAQILCTLIFCSLYQIANSSGGVDFYNGFGGYWFTIVLFQMYLIYLILSLTSRAVKHNIIIPSLIIISVLFINILVFFRQDTFMWNFLCWENLTKYMQFFTLGIICSKYKETFFKLLRNNIFITIVIVGWIVCMFLWYNTNFKIQQPLLYSFIHDIAVRYFSLMTVVVMFFACSETFSDNSSTSKALRFIGQRTLDIYMIHYFLIPNLSWLTPWIQSSNQITIQLIISLIVTIAIVSICLLISSILRKSDTLAAWLFGMKIKSVT